MRSMPPSRPPRVAALPDRPRRAVLVAKMPGLGRHEKALVVGTPGGEAPPYHRMFEAWFDDQAGLDAAFGSPEGKVVVDDLANFATGGVTIVISEVE